MTLKREDLHVPLDKEMTKQEMLDWFDKFIEYVHQEHEKQMLKMVRWHRVSLFVMVLVYMLLDHLWLLIRG